MCVSVAALALDGSAISASYAGSARRGQGPARSPKDSDGGRAPGRARVFIWICGARREDFGVRPRGLVRGRRVVGAGCSRVTPYYARWATINRVVFLNEPFV